MDNNSGEGNLAVLAFPKISEMEQFISACLKKPISIEEIIILRQRDFSIVARMELKGEAQSVIYKKVIAPWHCEAKVMQFLKDQNLPNAARIIGARETGESAQILQEDAGEWSLLQYPTHDLALLTGLALAQTHEAALDLTVKTNVFARLDNIERLQECCESNIFKLNALFPQLAAKVTSRLNQVAGSLSHDLSSSEFCLQHGDLYAENIIIQERTTPVFIDWSYFSMIGPRLYDLATLTSAHAKNGELGKFRQAIIEGYALGSGLSVDEIERQLPASWRLSRLLFLQWLLTRVEMGITQTTVGPVLPLIEKVVAEIIE